MAPIDCQRLPRRPKRPVGLLFSTVAVVGLMASACGGGAPSGGGAGGDSAAPLIIGDASSQTGFASGYDLPSNVGFRIKIDEMNAAGGLGGRKIEVVKSDSRSQVNVSGSAAIEVMDKGAEILLVACDYDVGAPAAIAAQDENKVSMSACAGSTKFGPEGIGPLAFTMSSPSTTMGAIMAEWVHKEHPEWDSAYVLEDTSIDYSKQLCAGFRQRWTELAGAESLVGSDTFKQDDASLATQITKMQSAQPKVIFPCSYNPGLARVMKQIRGAGMDQPILGDASIDGDEWKAAVPGLSNVYFPAYASIYGDDPDPKVNEFFKTYKTKIGETPPNSYPVLGYSVMEAFAKGIETAGGTDGQKVAAAIQAFNEEPLLAGPTTYTDQLHIALKRPMRVMQIQNGKTTYLKTWTPESVPLPKT